MTEPDLDAILDDALRRLGSEAEPGESFRSPPLEVLRYDRRRVRLHRLPWLGRAWSVVATARQPDDLAASPDGYRAALRRVAMAANGRFPPWKGPTIGLTTILLTPGPIRAEDDAALAGALGRLPRMRSVPLGLIALDLDREAMAFALARGPAGLFPEPEALADALAARFRRFVSLLKG